MTAAEPTSFFDQVLHETGVAHVQEPVDPDLIALLVTKHFGLDGRLERIATEKDDTFRLHTERGGDHLVKCSPSSEDPELVDLQSAAMVHLEMHHPELPVQRVLPTRDGTRSVRIDTGGAYPRVLRVLTYLPGSLLKETATQDEHWRLAGAMLGRVTRALEGFSHPRDDRRLLWDMANFGRLTELLDYVEDDDHRVLAHRAHDEYLAIVEPRLPGLESQVIHGDFSPFNAVVDPESPEFVTGVIDFGDVVRTRVVFDVAVGMANVIGTDPDDPWGTAAAFLGGYQQTRPLPDADVELLREIALGRLLLRALVVDWRAHVDPDRHAYLMSHADRDWACLERAHATDPDTVRTMLRASSTGPLPTND